MNKPKSHRSKADRMYDAKKPLNWAFGFATVFVVFSILAMILEARIESSPKPEIKTPLRIAVTVLKSEQIGQELENFTGISVAQLNRSEPNLNWQTQPLDSDDDSLTIQFSNSGDKARLANRSVKDICYFVELNPNGVTKYGSDTPNSQGKCDTKSAKIESLNQLEGWNL